MAIINTSPIPTASITGLILAGGQGTRLGGIDKGWLEFQGRPLIEHMIAALRPHVGTLIISANRHQDRYATLGWPVVADPWPENYGPLAGLLAGLEAATTEYVLCVPCDTPHLPPDFATRLSQAFSTEETLMATVAHGPRGLEPLHALLRRDLAPTLRTWLEHGGRAAHAWWKNCHATSVEFPEAAGLCFNINHAEDLR